MSKISKIQSMKQDKRYRNQTINILNHMNNKMKTPTLADKSLHNFKSIKPEVQSSRLTRYQPTKVSTKNAANYYIGYSRDKQKKMDTSQIGQKMSSKSLQSIHGSLKTYRKQQQKTKKNSFARLITQNGFGRQPNVEKPGAQISINNKRFKVLQTIFSNKVDQDLDNVNESLNKDLNKWQMPTNYISVKKSNNSSYRAPHSQNCLTHKLIENLNKKFQNFYEVIKQRKTEMIYDEIDYALYSVINAIQSNFLQILNSLLEQNERQIANTELTIQRILAEQQEELRLSKQKCQKIRQHYLTQIEGLLVKSLYTVDKINDMQKYGHFNFEHLCRQLDSNIYNQANLIRNEADWSQFQEDSLLSQNIENSRKENSIIDQYQCKDEYRGKVFKNVEHNEKRVLEIESKSLGPGYIKKIR